MYALDTNTIIYFLKDEGRVAQRWLAQPRSQLSIPMVVVYELEFGILKSKSPQRRARHLASLFDSVALLPFDRQASTEAAAIRLALEQGGAPIGPLDVLIAATARAHGATLVTRNTREFSRVASLRVENWYD